MKSEYLLWLMVLCQLNREGEMRAFLDSNSLTENTSVDSTTIRLPKNITEESMITINGTMKVADNVLSMALLDEIHNQLVCEMRFDVVTKSIVVESELFKNPEIMEYYLENEHSLKPTVFTVRMEARVYNGQQLINLYFEANDGGELPIDHCRLKSLKSVGRIVMRGVDTITSLLFKY